MSTVTAAPRRPGDDESTPPRRPIARLTVAGPTLLLAALLLAAGFVTAGGVDEFGATSANTWTEIALTLLGAAGVSYGLIRRPPGSPRAGWLTGLAMFALFALQAASIAWSAAPDASWLADGQMLAYLWVFGAAIVLARPWRTGWAQVLGALTLWAVALCGWSLLVKVFPAALASGNRIGRLQAPFGYWNAIALCAAMGVPACLWLGARRDGGRRLAGLAAPALCLVISVLVLSYSRSADLAAGVAAVVWLVCVPLRLRALAVLALGAAGAAVISAWALTHHGISGDGVALAAQDHAGHVFGIVCITVLVLVGAAGVALSETMDRVTVLPETRQRLGAGVIGLVILAIAAAVAGVATRPAGFSGEISRHWHELTNPAATVSATSASRVLQFGSSRPVYWHEALFVGDRFWLKGSGELGFSVARLLDPQFTTQVAQAHSYVFETFADLGVLGLAVSAALLAAWLAASARALQWRRRWSSLPGPVAAERAGLATLLAVVVAFGVQSTLDWTWYFTGVAVPALLAAGWLAGRGVDRLSRPVRARSLLDRPAALAAVVLIVVGALLGSWMVWRPLHAAQQVTRAENSGDFAVARSASRSDPFNLDADELLGNLALSAGRPGLARQELERGTRLQPRNPNAWEQLAQFLIQRRQYRAAIPALHQVQVLDRTQDTLTGLNNALILTAFHHRR